MRLVNLKNVSPYSEATLNVAPWYLRVCGDQFSERELTRDQIFVRDVVEIASSITTRPAMFGYLKSQRSYPMREMAVKDPRLHHFVRRELDHERLCKIDWDMFAHFTAALPLLYVRTLMHDEMMSKDRANKLVDNTLCAMSVFPLKTVFKSYAVMGLYFYQEFDPQLCSAFESGSTVPMASALSGLAKGYARRPNYELLAAAMMIASGDGYLDAARQTKDDPMMQQSHVRQALRSFGLATLFSFSVRENAHCFSQDIVDTLQRYAGCVQGSIKAWQDSGRSG
jgi:hypothetical protein